MKVHRYSIAFAVAVFAAALSASSAFARTPFARVSVAAHSVGAVHVLTERALMSDFEDRTLAIGFARMPFDEVYAENTGSSTSGLTLASVAANTRPVSTLAFAPTPGAVGLTVLIGCLTARRPRRA